MEGQAALFLKSKRRRGFSPDRGFVALAHPCALRHKYIHVQNRSRTSLCSATEVHPCTKSRYHEKNQV